MSNNSLRGDDFPSESNRAEIQNGQMFARGQEENKHVCDGCLSWAGWRGQPADVIERIIFVLSAVYLRILAKCIKALIQIQ